MSRPPVCRWAGGVAVALAFLGPAERGAAQPAAAPQVIMPAPASPQRPQDLGRNGGQGRAETPQEIKRREGAAAGVTMLDAAARCAEIVEKSRGAIQGAREFQRIYERQLAPMSRFLVLAEAESLRRQGKTGDVFITFSNFVVDEAVCSAAGPTCAGWMVGRSIGLILNEFPQRWLGYDRTVQDWFTDQYVAVSHPDPTPADYRRFFEAARRKIEEQKAASRAAQNEQRRCEASQQSPPPRTAVRTEAVQPAPPAPPAAPPRTEARPAPMRQGCDARTLAAILDEGGSIAHCR